jgi:hypothetical protein
MMVQRQNQKPADLAEIAFIATLTILSYFVSLFLFR